MSSHARLSQDQAASAGTSTSGWGITEGTWGTSKQTGNCYCKFLCLIHQNGAKMEFKYVGYFLFNS